MAGVPDGQTEGPLTDLKVLDLAGPIGAYCGKLLADLGADVVRIEPPGGDPMRGIGLFYDDDPDPEKSLYWWHLNTSKRGITLDLEKPVDHKASSEQYKNRQEVSVGEVTGARVVIDSLKREGVDTIYCLPGDPVGPIVTGWAKDGMRTIAVRHEQTAAMAAQAHSYLTHSVGVCVAASGVGQTNTLTGIANAFANCWPLLVIGGASELRRRNMGDFQELPQVEYTAPVSKWAYAAESIQRIPTLINIAIKQAMSGRPGPVYLDLPAEMISGTVDEDLIPIPPRATEPARTLADPQKVRQALEVLREAQRPLLIVGKGTAWSGAEDELLQFVEETRIPFLTSPMAMGMLPPDHPMNVSAARTQALKEADTILMAGARFNWIFHFGLPPRFAPDFKLVQIDIEPSEIGTNVPATVGLVGDAKMVVGQLVDALSDTPVSYGESGWLTGLKEKSSQNAQQIEPMLNSDAKPLGYYRVLKEIRDILPKDSILVADGASTMDISRQVIPVWYPRHRLDAGVAGCVGTGVPFAIAAKVVHPDKPVVCLQGDWAFGFNGMDVETAARFDLPIVWVIFQNGNIDRWVRSNVDNEEHPGDFKPNLRFDVMMEALGGHGEYVESPEEIRPALERAFNSGKASVVNVILDPDAGRRQQEFAWLAREGRMGY